MISVQSQNDIIHQYLRLALEECVEGLSEHRIARFVAVITDEDGRLQLDAHVRDVDGNVFSVRAECGQSGGVDP